VPVEESGARVHAPLRYCLGFNCRRVRPGCAGAGLGQAAPLEGGKVQALVAAVRPGAGVLPPRDQDSAWGRGGVGGDEGDAPRPARSPAGLPQASSRAERAAPVRPPAGRGVNGAATRGLHVTGAQGAWRRQVRGESGRWKRPRRRQRHTNAQPWPRHRHEVLEAAATDGRLCPDDGDGRAGPEPGGQAPVPVSRTP